ncbi:polymer-forming cytoskeletal protein [Paenibacillus oralis]|uniref:Polymer-forming cytoskeletal protein n=1 Tax=Paenibacillus oralis TaxID=2490856 RepID=A0A3P3U1N3_9BACL|nr:polymer-forming cytoskeletal protein [Paenibacillus oralis]RRJ64242.1 polymer-forming cytoskeletal protein [Paenibacillus oralis]
MKLRGNRQPERLDPNTTDTLIGEGSVFEGKIKSEAGVRVEGQITGDIECEGDVTVGEKGMVHSNILARNIIIAGEVHGNVQAKSKLSITSKGKLYGNIVAAALSIEEGSIFEGTSKMSGGASGSKTIAPGMKETAATSEAADAGKKRPDQDGDNVYKTW